MLMFGEKKDKERDKDKKKDKKSSKHDKEKEKNKVGASLSALKPTDDAHPLGINRSNKSLDLLASFPIAAINTANIYKTISRKTTNKFATLARYASKSLRDMHSSSDDQFNVTVDNSSYPIIQVNVYSDSAEVTHEITVPYPITASTSAPTTPTGASVPSEKMSILPTSASAVPMTTISSNASSSNISGASYGISGKVVIQGLPNTIDESSIRVKGVSGSATILEVAYKQLDTDEKTNNNIPNSMDVVNANTQLQDLEDQIVLKKTTMRRLTKEKEFLHKYTQRLSNAGGQGGTMLARDTLEGLVRWSDLHSEMLASISLREQEVTKELDELKQKLEKATKEKTDLSPSTGSSSVKKVVVSLFVPKSTPITLQLTYITRHVRWTPNYDIRVLSASDLLEVSYHAQVFNSTGEDWFNVPLNLSTGTPPGSTPPELRTSVIGFASKNDSHSVEASLSPTSDESARRMSIEKFSLASSLSGLQTSSSAHNAAISTSLTSDEFTARTSSSLSSSTSSIPVPYPENSAGSLHTSANFSISRVGSIESNGKGHKVTIAMLTLLSKYMYFAVPKLSPHAFLKASTTNTTEYPLLPGVAHIFFDTSFVTSSEMKLIQPTEDFETYLGIDRGVKVEWKTPQRYTEAGGMLAKVQHLTLASSTTIKNTKDKPISISLSDILPRPNDERIKVRVLEPDLLVPPKSFTSVKLIPTTQVLEWITEVGAGEEVRVPFKYSIEWPKNQEIDIF